MSNLDFDLHSTTERDPLTLVEILRERALHQGNRLAYTFLAEGEAEQIDLTYAELDRRSRAIGASLQLSGAARQRVLLLYNHGLEFIAGFLGCLYAGAIAVPAYPPRLNRSQLRFHNIIADSQAAAALTTRLALARMERVLGETPDAGKLVWLTTDEIDGGLEDAWREPAIDGEALAMIQYTSGSTSAPKGVMVSHRNLLCNERMIQKAFRQTENSVIAGWLPLYHDMGLIGNVLQPLFLGARCVLLSPSAFLQKPLRWLQAISDYRATTSGGPNFAYDLCVRKISPEERSRLDLSCWSVAFNGSEPIFPETLERFAAAFASCGFRRDSFYPCYGLAEATLLVSAGRAGAQSGIENQIEPAVNDGQRKLVGCGPILSSERVVIVDPGSLTQSPAEEVGEIWISGPNVAQGYWDRDQETEQTFRAYLKESGEGPFLRTGDLGYIKGGELFVTGRIKDLIIIRGRNHYPQDIELTVRQSHSILESGSCAAFSIEEADEERLVIVQELHRGAQDPATLIEGIREAVAREHEIQAHAVVFINKGRMPKTTSGKIQRYACRQEYRAGKLDAIAEWIEKRAAGAESVDSAPANGLHTIDALAIKAIEDQLRSFLSAKLNRPAERIGVDQPLLSYGIDSLTAIELAHYLESKLGVALPSADLLEDIGIAQLARRALDQLRRAPHDSKPAVMPVPPEVTEHPLSFGQRSLWFLAQVAPLSGAFNVSSAVRIQTRLNPEALRHGLQRIVDRHDSLRTTFLSREGEPLQRVHEQLAVRLPETDVSSWSEESLDDHLVEEAHRPFNLEQGPLLRVSLFTRSPQDHILLVVAHHIAVDLWSMGVLMHELGGFYRAEMGASAATPDQSPLQYIDYVHWQRRLLTGPEGERLWSYWRNQLTGDSGMLSLPADRPRPPLQSFRGDSRPCGLSLDLTRSLQSLGQQHQATLYMTLQAIFHVLLHRYTAQEEILVGTPTAGRSSAELAGSIGYFVNPVALRADLSENPPFSSFLGQIRETTLAAIAHQDYPFALLVERLQPARDPGRSPLFQVMFALQKAPSFAGESLASQALTGGNSISFGGLSAESISLRRRASYFDLSLILTETSAGLEGIIEYNADLFDEWRIQGMAGHFRTLAEAVIANPALRIRELELMTAAEREQVIVGFNRTREEYDRAQCIHKLFERQVGQTPEAVALIHEDRQLTYAELNRGANRLAHHLRRLGVGPEILVGICVERSLEMVTGLLGILKAGGAYVPLDPTYPAERTASALKDAQVRVLLTQAPLLEGLPAGGARVVTLDQDWPLIESESAENPPDLAMAENPAYAIYTSGSTGSPKGVSVPHNRVVNFFSAMDADLAPAPAPAAVWLAVTSTSFDISVLELLWTLARGFQVVAHGAQRGAGGEEPSVLAQITRHQVTHLQCTPSVAEALSLEADWIRTLSSLRQLMIGGEAFPTGLAESLKPLVTTEIHNMYGPTETTIWSATYTLRGAEGSVPIGRPVMNTQIYVLDRSAQVVPVGVPGEVYIGGDGVVRGYLNQPGATAERFLPDPFGAEAGARLYRTGDLARYRSDWNLEYLWRLDHQVKVRGFRIELGEIETWLGAHPSVRQCVVTARQGEPSERQLVAYLVGEGERRPSAGELRGYLKERLPEYMLPARFVWLEQMPLTPNGKVDRRALPAPPAEREAEREASAAPRRPIEDILVGIFEEVLKLDRLGISDNFFEMGGHSLLATQVVSRVRKAFGVEIGVTNLFNEATVEGLARRVEQALEAGERATAPPLVRTSREGRLPLSFAQQRSWFLDQLVPDNPFYNISGGVKLEGRLELGILERAINELVKRHEVLRTRIGVEEDGPVQVIDQWKSRKLEVEDLTSLNPDERELEVKRILREETRTGFDLSRGPLLRVKTLKLEEEEHVLFFTMHHIVSDAWSIGVLARELCALYEALSANRESPLPELEIQYADFASWQRQYLTGDVMKREIGYWKEQLKDAAVMKLPADYARPATPSYRGGREKIEIDRESTLGLKRLSRQEGATLFMALMAAFKVILMRYSGEEDVVIGTVIANRTWREVEGLIGFFANTLVMRTHLSGNPSFRELIRREREVALEAYLHQEVPFEKLVEEINPQRDLSRNPLFQVMMVLQNAEREELKIRGVRVREIVEEIDTAKFDLTMTLTEDREGIQGTLEYSLDLYNAETIGRMVRHYEQVVVEVARDAEQKIREIELLSEAEKWQILGAWNETQRQYEEARLAPELVATQAGLRPDGLAVKCDREQLSYRELNERANQLAGFLRELGVGPEVRVGICLERSIEMVVGLLGILKAGGAYVPMDPSHPDQRLKTMIEDADLGLVLTQAHLAERCSGQSLKTICLDRDWEAISARSSEDPPALVQPQNAAYVIYTSGSTGRPKGVIVTHQSLLNLFNAVNENLGLGEHEIWTWFHSASFDFSVWEIWGALIYGGTLVVTPHLVARMPEEFYHLVLENNVTILSQTPLVFQHFIKVSKAAKTGRGLNLRAVIFGGEALEFQSLKGWVERYGDESPYLINMYGVTETTVHTTYQRVTGELIKDARGSIIGKPLANVQMYVLDEHLQPAPMGVAGDLYVAGEGLARGYLGREELTAERFLPSPFSREPGARVYRTGDLARYLSDGRLEYLGRRDHQVKIRGYRIELGEIEAALLQYEAIREAAVISRDEPGRGPRLVAYLVNGNGEKLMIGELNAYLKQRLPDYMAPAAFIVMDSMPLTPNGKLDRRALPGPERAESETAALAPRTPLEEMLVGIFEEVLQIDPVGIHDDFFELGGHSLLAAQAVSQARKTFGVEIGVRNIFEAPTVEGLGRKIEEALRAGAKLEEPPLVRVSRTGRLPLSFAQQRLWFLDQFAPNNPFYNLPGAMRLEGKLDLAALESVINQIVRRHEALRTRIEVEEGEPIQVIDEWEPRSLRIEDLASMPREEKAAEVKRLAREEAETGFDLRQGPLFRMKVLRLGAEEHVMIFNMHHIVSDEWSVQILIKEIETLYRAHWTGAPDRAEAASPLGELPIQYADFAAWQMSWLQGEVLERELDYWRRQLAGVESLKLPIDHPRPPVESHRGAEHAFSLEAGLADALNELSRQEGVTLFMVLLAAFQTLLYRYTGQKDLVVGTPIANRNRVELEPLIGFFVNTLAMRTRLSSEISFRSLLHQVRETALAAYSHDQAPFGKLVEELSPNRAVGQNPLFQAWFFLNQQASDHGPTLPDLTLSPVKIDFSPAKLDLALLMTASSNNLAGTFVYATDLFEPETIRILADRFQALLKALTRDPDGKLLDLPLTDFNQDPSVMEAAAAGALDEMQTTFIF